MQFVVCVYKIGTAKSANIAFSLPVVKMRLAKEGSVYSVVFTTYGKPNDDIQQFGGEVKLHTEGFTPMTVERFKDISTWNTPSIDNFRSTVYDSPSIINSPVTGFQEVSFPLISFEPRFMDPGIPFFISFNVPIKRNVCFNSHIYFSFLTVSFKFMDQFHMGLTEAQNQRFKSTFDALSMGPEAFQAASDFIWTDKVLSNDISKPAVECLNIPAEYNTSHPVEVQQYMLGLFCWTLVPLVTKTPSASDLMEEQVAKYQDLALFNGGTEPSPPPAAVTAAAPAAGPSGAPSSDLPMPPGSPQMQDLTNEDMGIVEPSGKKPRRGQGRKSKDAPAAAADEPAAPAKEASLEDTLDDDCKSMARHLKLLEWMTENSIPAAQYPFFYKMVRSCWSNKKPNTPAAAVKTWVMGATQSRTVRTYELYLASQHTHASFVTEMEEEYKKLAASLTVDWDTILAYKDTLKGSDQVPRDKEQVPLISTDKDNAIKGGNRVMLEKARALQNKAILKFTKACSYSWSRPHVGIETREENQALIDSYAALWYEQGWIPAQIVIDDKLELEDHEHPETVLKRTPAGNELLKNHKLLAKAMAEFMSEEEWIALYGFRLYVSEPFTTSTPSSLFNCSAFLTNVYTFCRSSPAVIPRWLSESDLTSLPMKLITP
jgi:hypothetical protein